MSRVGKHPITIPSSVTVTMTDGVCRVEGPKGILEEKIDPRTTVTIADGAVTVSVQNPEDKQQHSFWGLYRQLISNMVHGVTEGFSKQLEVNGVGYKAEVKGKVLVMQLGYSHPIEYQIPEDIEVSVEKNVITVSGSSKQQVGQVAAEIRSFRKPEPYKGKGIKYTDEVIRRKAGKAAAKAAG